jgi:hypothetical protein
MPYKEGNIAYAQHCRQAKYFKARHAFAAKKDDSHKFVGQVNR